jgi:lysyl-tRNA synthetase class 1
MVDKKSHSHHFADIFAANIVREKGEKELYVCASGITPSGTVHIGNFREIISVDLVVRALRDMGKKVRFLYSWDEFDVFRKVPKNLPEGYDRYLRIPITMVPDSSGQFESFAQKNERDLEKELHRIGISPDYIYQAEKYRACSYAAGIKKALAMRDEIKQILDSHRTEPLLDGWQPVSIFCSSCTKDTTIVDDWDGGYNLSYTCNSCGNKETVDFRKTGIVKLPWRIDWPMRWSFEKVDFEPAGKDHHSEGGSFDTASKISKQIFNYDPPVSFQYDFIGIKGRGGKISSSSGDVISLADVLEVYELEVTRYLFAGTRPNAEFSISFDLDVLKIYEDYDRCERIYFHKEAVNEKRAARQRRIYELSQVGDVAASMPLQVSFRHMTTVLQINGGNIDATVAFFGNLQGEDAKKLSRRAQCALNWVNHFAPDDFRFALQGDNLPPIELNSAMLATLIKFREFLRNSMEKADEKAIATELYSLCAENGVPPKSAFVDMYRILLGKDKGPRLATFLLTIGKAKTLSILDKY